MNFESIDGVNLPFDENWDSVAISLSGGADSALLATLICDLINEKNAAIRVHIISHTRMWKTRPWQQYDSLNVFEYLQNRYTSITFVRHTNFIAPDVEYGNMGPTITDEYGKQVSGDNAQIRAFSEYVCFNNKIDAYFNGVTKNPSGVSFTGMTSRDIKRNENNRHLEFMIHMDKIVSHPFRFVDKRWVVSQYKKRNLMDLLNITRSCEGEFEDITYKNYTRGQYVPLCNSCFWCKERAWALNEI